MVGFFRLGNGVFAGEIAFELPVLIRPVGDGRFVPMALEMSSDKIWNPETGCQGITGRRQNQHHSQDDHSSDDFHFHLFSPLIRGTHPGSPERWPRWLFFPFWRVSGFFGGFPDRSGWKTPVLVCSHIRLLSRIVGGRIT